MKNKTESNYFIIERLDKDKKADSLSTIYNLEPLNIIKEVKPKNDCQSIIKMEDAEKIIYGEKAIIIQTIKKAILSSNFSYKWNLISTKYFLLIIQFTYIIILIIYNIFFLYQSINTSSSIINKVDSFVVSNTTLNFNHSINNYTNEFKNNSIYSNETNSNEEKEISSNYNIFINPIFNLLLMIPIWIIYFFKFIPQRDEINEIMYKFTKYLLICESFKNKKYYYHLRDDYSILITKKDYFISNIDSSKFNERFDPEKNIFLYSINYIYDYRIEDIIESIYYNLISNQDKITIIIFKEFIETLLRQNKTILKKFIISLLIIYVSSFFYNKTLFYYISIFNGQMTIISFLVEYFCNEYYNKLNEEKLDLFINIYNNEYLLKKRKFIYRRNKLIMFLTLKDNISDKNQIIKSIEKIINS